MNLDRVHFGTSLITGNLYLFIPDSKNPENALKKRDITEREKEFLKGYLEVETRKELSMAVKYLREGKQKFAPGTTNSFVDDFLEKHKDL